MLCLTWFVQGIRAQTVSYNFIEDDPALVRNLSFAPFNYGFDFGKKALPLGNELFYTGHHVSLEANFLTSGASKDTTRAMARINPYRELDLMAAIHIIDKTEDVSQKITVSSHSDGTYRYEKYFDVDVKVRKIKAVRIGFETYNSYLQATVLQPGYNFNTTHEYVNYRTTMLCLGLLSKRVFNYVLDYGATRTMKRMREVYLDFLIPISSKRDSTVLPEYDGGGNKPLYHPLGGRLGWMHHSARIMGLYFKLEAGWLPGYQVTGATTSYYTKLMIGFCFSSGVAKHVQL